MSSHKKQTALNSIAYFTLQFHSPIDLLKSVVTRSTIRITKRNDKSWTQINPMQFNHEFNENMTWWNLQTYRIHLTIFFDVIMDTEIPKTAFGLWCRRILREAWGLLGHDVSLVYGHIQNLTVPCCPISIKITISPVKFAKDLQNHTSLKSVHTEQWAKLDWRMSGNLISSNVFQKRA
jgi:hypothetical protein